MTTQEAYEKMVAHFSKPGAELARDADYNCYYRRNDGEEGDRRYERVRCAVGCLIPNTLYDSVWEDTGIDSDAMIEFGLTSVSQRFLVSAQGAHDSRDTEDAADFIAKLHKLAAMHELDVIA